MANQPLLRNWPVTRGRRRHDIGLPQLLTPEPSCSNQQNSVANGLQQQ